MLELPERITLWRRKQNTGFGGAGWNAPELYDARIAYSQKRFTDINGDEVTSTAVCYTDAPIDRDDIKRGVYVLLGVESTAPEPPEQADDVRALSHTPSGDGVETLRKFWFA